MIPRDITETAKKLASWFPVVSVTGPRQSGKSTLVRHAFEGYNYVNLEDPNLRALANEDPVGFIRNRPEHLIIDEAQYVPDLFSMVQVVSDERNRPGQYILSGSQNFLLLKRITQSLAGRVGVLRLLPLSFNEAQQADPTPSADEFMLAGGYPRPYDTGMERAMFFDSYLDTYVARDVADYLDVRNTTSFRTMLGLLAANAGNLLNLSKLADGADVSFATAKSWLSILESSYIVFRLQPWHANIGKRLTKAAKIYFHDTGLLCHLLGITNLPQLLTHPALGAIFENLIVAETLKAHYHHGEKPQLFFYRDDSKREIDLLDFTHDSRRRIIEIKSSQTYHPRFAKTIVDLAELFDVPAQERLVVYRGDSDMNASQFQLINATEYLTTIEH